MTAGDAPAFGDVGNEARQQGCAVSVIVPTRNEAPNIELLEQRLSSALDATPGGWELIFVDDSDDPTPEVITRLVNNGRPVRLLHREKGLAPVGSAGPSRRASHWLAALCWS